MGLTTLPNELLILLPQYLDNIESYTNLAGTCHRLRDALYAAHPNTILQLAAASETALFSPQPHVLVAATARQLSDWALGHNERTGMLRAAFRDGIDGLYSLCLKHSGLTLERIRWLYLARSAIIDPLSDKIDRMTGGQCYPKPFFGRGVDSRFQINCNPLRAALQLIIYGELFGRSMDAFLQPEKNLPYFDTETRLEYLTYCVPDKRCKSYPGFQVLESGPYRPGWGHLLEQTDDQIVLRYILKSHHWKLMWGAAINRKLLEDHKGPFQISGRQVENWRTLLLRQWLYSQGFLTMQLVTYRLNQAERARFYSTTYAAMRQIETLETPPASEQMGKSSQIRVSGAPDSLHEIKVCCDHSWP